MMRGRIRLRGRAAPDVVGPAAIPRQTPNGQRATTPDTADPAGVPRRVLEELRAAGTGTGLDEIARRAGVSRDDVDAAVGYWLHRGELSARRLDCGPTDCTGCALRAAGCGPASRPGSGKQPPGAGNRTSVTVLHL